MDNQYNYYNPDGQQGNAQYNSQQNFNSDNKKPKAKVPKAVMITGCALLFGVVSSATFLTSNIVGSKILGLNTSQKSSSKSTAEVSNTSLTKTSSVVTSDVSGVVESVMPVSYTHLDVYKRQGKGHPFP